MTATHLYDAGKAAFASGAIDKGVALLKQAVTIEPATVEIMYHLSRGLERLHRFDECKRVCSWLAAVGVPHEDAAATVARDAWRQQDYRRAADWYRHAVALRARLHATHIAGFHQMLHEAGIIPAAWSRLELTRIPSTPHRAAVIVPAHNHASTLRMAVESALTAAKLAADALDVRTTVIVVDDHSTDATATVAQALTDQHPTVVRAVIPPYHGGPGAARNYGVSVSDADYLFFLDADDVFLPRHMLRCLGVLIEHGWAHYVRSGVAFTQDVHTDYVNMAEQSAVWNVCLRRWVHDAIGGFVEAPPQRILIAEDAMYSRMLAAFFDGVRYAEKTVRYTIGKNNSAGIRGASLAQPIPAAGDPLIRLSPHAAQLPLVDKLFQAQFNALATRLLDCGDR